MSLTDAQIGLQRQAAQRLDVIMEETLAELGAKFSAGTAVSESNLSAFIVRAIARDGLESEEAPLVAAGVHGADPQYSGADTAPIARDRVVLIDVTAKKKDPGAIYADLTWVAFTGPRKDIPPRMQRAWLTVRKARDAAIERLEKPGLASGADVDAVARKVISDAGLASWFPHPAGHSLGESPYGSGPHLAAGEKRTLAANGCWAIEPAVYYTDEYGLRAEADVCLTLTGGAEVTTGVPQREIRTLER
jgi:Xaa-Pro dipeptidase